MQYAIGRTFDINNPGWVVGTKENGSKIFLHQNLLVDKTEQDKKIESITIFDSLYAGIKCKIPLDLYDRSHLVKPIQSSVQIQLLKSSIVVDGEKHSVSNTLKNTGKPYYIGHPIFQQSVYMPNTYFIESKGGTKFARTWFPVVSDGKVQAYLHIGKVSKGCLTVFLQETDIWTDIYLKLISSRLSKKYLCSVTASF